MEERISLETRSNECTNRVARHRKFDIQINDASLLNQASVEYTETHITMYLNMWLTASQANQRARTRHTANYLRIVDNVILLPT